MADDDASAAVVLHELAQPDHGIGVEVVGGLVEDHRLGGREEDAREFDPAALAAGERLELLVEDAVGQVQVARDRRGLRLGGVAAQGVELVGEGAVRAHRRGADPLVVAGHLEARLLHAERDGAEPAGVEDAGARQHLRVAGARVLRQVADLAGAFDLPLRGQGLPRERLGQRGLAGTVSTDQADLVSVGDAEADVLHEYARPHTDLEVLHVEHSNGPFRGGGESSRPDRANYPVYLLAAPASYPRATPGRR